MIFDNSNQEKTQVCTHIYIIAYYGGHFPNKWFVSVI